MSHSNLEPLAYTVPAFCRVVGFAKSKAYQEANAGRLRIVKAGGRSLVLADEAHRYLASLPLMKASAA